MKGKGRFTNPLLLLTLIVGFGYVPLGQLRAQTFTVLHSFSGGGGSSSGLISDGSRLLGTAQYDGHSGQGSLFAINTNGSGFTNFYSFTPKSTNSAGIYTNSDGANPRGSLILSGNTLYGTTSSAGDSGSGTVFAVTTDGSGFRKVHSFNGSDGAGSVAALVLSGSTLYGTTTSGGTLGRGTVFAVQTNGLGFTLLHSFSGGVDGGEPSAPLCLKSNTLYGTAAGGGTSGSGTVFAINTDASGFTVLHSFTQMGFNPPGTNSDGASPIAGLILLGDTLYGAARFGGPSAYGSGGTLFAVNTDGTGFRLVHSFSGNAQDGNNPNKLVLMGNTLYGTATVGGIGALFGGTVFQVKTEGTGFAVLHAFNYKTDGGQPSAELLLFGGMLYGTSFCCGSSGGPNGGGTVFSLSLGPGNPPRLSIVPYGANVISMWPTNATGFTLQSATNLASPDWITNFAPPVVINGQNTVTNPISGPQRFFRLSQ